MAGNRPAIGLSVNTVQEATNLIAQRKVFRFTPTIPSASYGNGDVLFNPVEITNAVLQEGGCSRLEYAVVIDNEDQSAAAFDLIFMQVSKDLGTVDGAVDISLANLKLAKILGHLHMDSDNNISDLVNAKLLTGPGTASGMAGNNSIFLQAEPGSTSVFVAGVARSAYNTTDGSAHSDHLEIILGIDY